MKRILLIFTLLTGFIFILPGQNAVTDNQDKAIEDVINQYQTSRMNKNKDLLSNILSDDIDQLVSSGSWRRGKAESMEGMLRSSNRNPGKRTLKVESIRYLQSDVAIVDTRYTIERADGTARKMWSTFLMVNDMGKWKISAIRNMLPAN